MKIKSKELLLKNLGNDDSIPDNPFTSLEKLRKYLKEGKSNDSSVFYVDTINYFGEGLIEKDKSEEVLIMEMDKTNYMHIWKMKMDWLITIY